MLKRYGVSKRDVWRAIIYGGIVGLIGVAAFVIFLKVDWDTKKIDVLAPVEDSSDGLTPAEVKTFYALQHGVYSSEEQAQTYIASDPALIRAIVLPLEGRYYVWSRVASATDGELKAEQGISFVKSFQLDGSGCEKESLRALPKWLASENSIKFNFGDSENAKSLPEDWKSVRTTAIGISEDMDVVRMHLIFHYISSSSCLKIKFN